MKYNKVFIVALLFGVASTINIHKDDGAADASGDLDALMDKYDDQEKVKNKPAVKTVTNKNGVTVTKGEV
jgi:hypothetical protein